MPLHSPTNVSRSLCAVVIPVYKPIDAVEEILCLRTSLTVLQDRDIIFIGPESARWQPGFDISPYRFWSLAPEWFVSKESYSRLLTSGDFYAALSGYQHLLIVQPDALVVNDRLDEFCGLPVDYLGAPWPNFWFDIPDIDAFREDKIRLFVGNGGLSLRRVSSVLRLLESGVLRYDGLPRAINEDIWFSMAALLSEFRLGSYEQASRFALEENPVSHIQAAKDFPMGYHALFKFSPLLWQQYFPHAALGRSVGEVTASAGSLS